MRVARVRRVVVVAAVRAVGERAIGCEPFEQGGLDAEGRGEHVAPRAVQEVECAGGVGGCEVGLELVGGMGEWDGLYVR